MSCIYVDWLLAESDRMTHQLLYIQSSTSWCWAV